MHKARFFIPAVIVSIGLYLVLDITAAQVCKTLCKGLWLREHRQKFRIRNEIYHHTLAPSVSVIDKWGDRYYPLITNNLGFRDATPRDISLIHNGLRILFIGDSFTEGQGVTWSESFVGRIALTFSDENIDVLNAGVSSYAPAVYLAKLRHFIGERSLSIDHVFALIDISDVKSSISEYKMTNDHRAIGRFDPPKPDPYFIRRIKKWLKRNSVTAAFIYKVRDFLSYQMKMHRVDEAFKYRPPQNKRARIMKVTEHNAGSEWCFLQKKELAKLNFDVLEGIRLAQEQMTDLHRFLAERQIGLSVIIYPWPANVIESSRRSRCETIWKNWAEKYEVDLINLFDVFMKDDDPSSVVRRFFIPQDVHWNAEGHKLVAKSIVDHILKRTILGLTQK